MKIAIIGSGISGLTAGYFLHQEHDIHIFEANNWIGGHTHTVDVDGLAIDTGFIVFNDRTYPHFKGLMDKLGVEYRNSEMSFSVRHDDWNLEYNGNNINSLFADRRNLIRPKFYSLIREILRFNKLAKNPPQDEISLGKFLIEHKFNQWFIEGYILPMGSAIWSMGTTEMLDFPFKFFALFFKNHGLLDVQNRPQWFTISGGSRNYIPKLIAGFEDKIHLNTPIQKVFRQENHVTIQFPDNSHQEFDQVIFACHSDQALQLLAEPSNNEQQILGAIKYSDNEVILHNDTNLLPKNKRAYASWNYLINPISTSQATVSYNMNILQGLNSKKTYCVALNSGELIAPELVLAKFNYSHPVYSKPAIQAQARWQEISGQNNSHFCGAYWANGFHEDGVLSAIKVCQTLGSKNV